jgi:hypothetical protein
MCDHAQGGGLPGAGKGGGGGGGMSVPQVAALEAKIAALEAEVRKGGVASL